MSLFRWPPRIAQYPSLGEIPPIHNGKRNPGTSGAAEPDHAYADAPVYEADQQLLQEGRKTCARLSRCTSRTTIIVRQHKSLRITPMAAGVSDRLWTLEELVEQTSR